MKKVYLFVFLFVLTEKSEIQVVSRPYGSSLLISDYIHSLTYQYLQCYKSPSSN